MHINSPKLCVNPPGGSQGSTSRRSGLQKKRKKSCFCFYKCWDYCEKRPLICLLPYFTWLQKTFSAALCVQHSVLYLRWDPQFYVSPLMCSSEGCHGALELLLKHVFTCATHIQMMDRSVWERVAGCGPMTHLYPILLLLINIDDTIFYTLSLTINGNYAMLFTCHP